MTSTDHRSFYNSASEFYDNMINFSSSVENRIEWFKTIVTDRMKKAADVGCGSGLDSIALSKLGLNVTGFDVSEGMIEQAKKNADAYNVHPDFERSEIDRISTKYNHFFDLVTSLGNTFANIEPDKLLPSLDKIKKILIPAGTFVLQILNYDLILEQQERIVNIKKSGKFTLIRFYDFYPEHLDFNILKFESDRPESREILTTTIYPHKADYIVRKLRGSGFAKINMFGSLRLEEFDKNTSKDLIIVAETPGS